MFSGVAAGSDPHLLFRVINSKVIDPLIVLMAVPFALGGVMWRLFPHSAPIQCPGTDGYFEVHLSLTRPTASWCGSFPINAGAGDCRWSEARRRASLDCARS